MILGGVSLYTSHVIYKFRVCTDFGCFCLPELEEFDFGELRARKESKGADLEGGVFYGSCYKTQSQ